MTVARAVSGRWGAPASVIPHVREVGIVAGAYFAYMYTRSLVFSDVESTALSNARRVVSLEKSLGFFWEPQWQAWVLGSAKGLVIFFNWAYIVTFFPIIITAAVTIYMVDRHRYFYYRNVVMLTFVFALIVFMLFPLAPPRMLSNQFVDTIQQFGPRFYASREAANYYNAFAAMPSLHFTWTAIFGFMFFRSGRTWLKVVGVVYPLMTLFAITITGNHFIVDAIAGVAIMLAALGTAWLYQRLRHRSKSRHSPHQPALVEAGPAEAERPRAPSRADG